jgi:hypothetical protein
MRYSCGRPCSSSCATFSAGSREDPIAGAGWAALNEIAFWFAPATFSINPDLTQLVGEWHGRLALFLYYSMAQMMTIGYSDVTPLRAPATTLSLFAALFGLFYTAIVVAQFVGMAQSGGGGDRNTP